MRGGVVYVKHFIVVYHFTPEEWRDPEEPSDYQSLYSQAKRYPNQIFRVVVHVLSKVMYSIQ